MLFLQLIRLSLVLTGIHGSALPDRRDTAPNNISAAALVSAYMAALSDNEIAPDSDENVTDSAVRLVGFEGCSSEFQVPLFYGGWAEARRIMQLDAIKNGKVDFNTAGALDYLGPSSLNAPRQADFNAIFKQWATIKRGYTWFNWRLHVRCDDPLNMCPCGLGDLVAYTTNKDADTGLARINFCPDYFTRPSLTGMVRENKNAQPFVKFNMDQYYKTRGHIWAHELLHIDWVSGASSSNTIMRVLDLRVQFRRPETGDLWTSPAYSPEATKILARWPVNPGDDPTCYRSIAMDMSR